MATDLGPIGVGLALLFSAFLFILAIQLYYLFLRPRINHLTQDHCHSSFWSSSSSSSSSSSGSSNRIQSSESQLNNRFWWQKITRDEPVQESEEDCEAGPQYTPPFSAGEPPPSTLNNDEDILQTLQELVGPPRLLFTITEETLEDLVENNDDYNEISDRNSGTIPGTCCDLSEDTTPRNPNPGVVLEENVSSSVLLSPLSASAPLVSPKQLGHSSVSTLFENSPPLPGRGSLICFHHIRIHPLDDHNCIEVQS